MVTFDQFWQQLYDHGASLYHRCDCFDLWNTLSISQQQQLYTVITDKLRDRRFVDYNPLRAMRDNLNRLSLPATPPANYFGRPLPRGFTFYRADYHGIRGLYTEQDVRAHHMTNPELFAKT